MTTPGPAGAVHKGPGAVRLVLEGDLDAVCASTFREEIDRVTAGAVDQLVIDMTKVCYLSSAGLRMLVYARQRLPRQAGLVIVGANEPIKRTIRLVGLRCQMSSGV